jgi:adenosylhomocysteine nucleosidase
MPLSRRSAEILYVMAVENEYGLHLQARITPLMTGVGPVEAAVVVTQALTRLSVEDRLPAYVVSLGSAGSRTLEQCGVYQAISVAYRDMDASALGFEKGLTPFLGLPAALVPGPLVPGIPGATLATGASVVSGMGYDDIEAEMVDMESYGVLRACQRFEVPLIVLRGISDGDSELGHIDDWTRYLHVIDEKLALTVDVLEAAVAAHALE